MDLAVSTPLPVLPVVVLVVVVEEEEEIVQRMIAGEVFGREIV